jgi:isopentenyl phosphate kinase
MPLVFLKLGGSLITDKTRPYTARLEKLDDLAAQIATALHENADLRLVLGHGSGSFGHTAASQFDTRRGVSGPEAWRGFAEVWYQASRLNRLVVEALRRAGLPAVTFSAAASVTAHDRKVFVWDCYPLQSALANGLLPVVHGDVAFDQVRNGTILSTEDLFVHLAQQLHPERILLAGKERGVWADFPARQRLLEEITPGSFAQQAPGLGGAAGIDVTGGMLSKVTEMLTLVEQVPGLEVLIFSGEEPGIIQQALRGGNPGTHLTPTLELRVPHA